MTTANQAFEQASNHPGAWLGHAWPEVAPAKQQGPWTTYFTDASNNNGPVDWREVAHNSRRTGITGTELKATEGIGFTDGYFHGWRDECERFGLRMMPYHYARPDVNPADVEAEYFCNVVGAMRPGEWRPMLDFETPPFNLLWLAEWCTHVRKRLGVEPVVYSYWAALEGMHLPRPLGAGLILAYPNGLPKVAPCPPPWKHWSAHQYNWHGHVDGFNGEVDLNWTPAVRSLLAYPIRGAALEPVYAARRRRA